MSLVKPGGVMRAGNPRRRFFARVWHGVLAVWQPPHFLHFSGMSAILHSSSAAVKSITGRNFLTDYCRFPIVAKMPPEAPQTVQLPRPPEELACIRKGQSRGGSANTMASYSEAGKKGIAERRKPKPGRIPINETWKSSPNGRKHLGLPPLPPKPKKPPAPPKPTNVEIRCPANCGFTMIAADRIQNSLARRHIVRMACPNCKSEMRIKRQTRAFSNYMHAVVELVPKEEL